MLWFRFTFVLLICFFWQIDYSFSQEIQVEDYSSDSVIYKHTLSGGIIFHNRGLGLKIRKGRNINISKEIFYEANLINLKSAKQIKSINPYYPNSKSFVYGKLNELFVLRAGMGYSRLLNPKPYWGGVELRFVYAGGVSLGLAKPVYFYIAQASSGYESYETKKFEPGVQIFDVVSRAPFTKGFNQLNVHPGLYFKAGFDFEFGAVKSKINRLEVGAVIDLFVTQIQLLADNNPQQFFFTMYLSYSFGKRYNIY
jgi:hypothetical protein